MRAIMSKTNQSESLNDNRSSSHEQSINSQIRNSYLEKLKIISINTNSIITNQRRADLIKLLENNDPDIALLSETKLVSKHKLSFKNYKMVRTDRPNSVQGGAQQSS